MVVRVDGAVMLVDYIEVVVVVGLGEKIVVGVVVVGLGEKIVVVGKILK